MSDSDRHQPSDTMRERVSESSRMLWLLLDVDRWIIAGLFSATLFLFLLAAGIAHPTPPHTLLTRGDPAETLYQALITGTITGVTLVLTLSQLILSQELGAVGDQRERMEGAMRFRDDVADSVGAAVSPAEPSAFLRSLVRATKERAQSVEEAVDEGDGLDDDLLELLSAYLDSVVGNADEVTDQLEGRTFGEFDVVEAALNYNYSWKLYAGRRIREEYGEGLSEEALDALDELIETLKLFGPAREHFKTLYFQWELANLSRALLYIAVPALAVAIGSLILFDPQDFSGTTYGVANSLLLVATTTTVSLLPFTVLLAYILRIVTITKRTLSIGPFILRETERSVDVNWD
ncbi:hypothetical protein [Haloarcula nitratireducens]|uniref:Uncharacterized protein n=1 Tax=Haloarcula nitratireducens TaxID=2487749 RepID=A0AAW4PB31_9EURY|nr:hypothetical protein [Halomicroarcula nitratireducens]MBX0295104.1 hypothetical protein [Halomicroarcula nitratireducens]